MNSLFKFLKSSGFLKGITAMATLVYIFLIVIYKMKIGGSRFINNDNYAGHFKTFLKLDYYDGVAKGTSILYNLVLKEAFYFIGNIEMSFILINGLSHLFLLVFSCYLLKKIDVKKDIYFYIIGGLFILFIINQGYFISASNDAFLSVFTLILFNYLIFKIYEKRYLNYYFISIGLLVGVCFAIRPTAIYLLPIVVFSFIVWFRNTSIKTSNKVLKIVLTLLSFVLLTVCFHYPSIKENGTLSFYDKLPENISENWVQRNYLGWKKIEQGKESMNRDAIWIHTKFENVRQYLDENGEGSLPRTFLGVLKKDPILFMKIGAYNVAYSVLRFLRFWGFLLIFLILPLIKYKKKSILSRTFLSSNILIVVIPMISFTCLTFIEERWYIAYEILIPMGILFYLKNKQWDKSLLNMVFSLSLILVTIMNLRSITSYL